MIPQETLIELATLGLSRDQAEAVARMLRAVEDATKAEGHGAIERRRSSDRERKQRQRAKIHVTSRDVTGQDGTECDQKEMSPTPPIRKTTSSLRSDVDPPPPSGVTPVVEKQKRASRLPENWTLPESYREAARQRGIADEEIDRQAARMLNWSLSSKAGAKLDWFRTWLNWIDDCPRQAARGSPTNVTPIRRRNVSHMLMEMLEEENREREEKINSEAFELLPLVHAER